MLRVMGRLNLTLDRDTEERLDRRARSMKTPRATLAREMLRESLERQDSLERRRRLASDYASGRGDARGFEPFYFPR